ncbi:MAG: hypothetical protein JXJ22_11190 [Bacteroidales bacterium]|nr:hypothetical protein [Bacteroidales bacterium]
MISISDLKTKFFKVDTKKDPSTYVWSLIIDFFNQDSLLRSRSKIVVEKLKKPFFTFNSLTEKVCFNLESIIKNEPSLVYNLLLDFMQDRSLLTKLVDMTRKSKSSNNEDILYRLDFIADTYESIELLKLPASIISYDSNRSLRLSTKDSILKHLKAFGLSKKYVNNIRLIRNSLKHKFYVDDENLVFVNGEIISLLALNKLYELLEDILSWYTTFIFRSIYLIPKFGLIIILTFYLEIKENQNHWEKYGIGIKTFYKDFLDQIENEKKVNRKKKKSLKKRLKRLSKRFVFYIKYRVFKRKSFNKVLPDIFYANFFHLVDKAYYHTKSISDELLALGNKMDDDIIKGTLLKIADWFDKKSSDIEYIKDYFLENPEKIIDTFENKLPPTSHHIKTNPTPHEKN